MSSRLAIIGGALVFFGLVVLNSASLVFGQGIYFDQPPVEPDFSGRIDLPFSGQRVWRGLELNPDAVFQPFIRLNDRGLEVQVGTSMDLTDHHDNLSNLNEWHYRIGFARREVGAEASLTYNYYAYPRDLFPKMTKTQEVALETSWGLPLVNSFNAYWDFDEVHGFYFNYSLGYQLRWGRLTILPRVGAGYATKRYQRYYFDSVRPRHSFLDLEGSLLVELEVVPGAVVMAEGVYYELARGGLREYRRENAEGDRYYFRGGMSLRF